MQIIVNHLTRMQHGYICVAGLDLATGDHVRPDSPGRLTVRHLTRYGGPFALGGVVDLGRVHPHGRSPTVEDCRVDPHRLHRLRQATANEFWEHVSAVSRLRLTMIFGPALTVTLHGAGTVAVGQGIASLGCLLIGGPRTLYLKRRPNRLSQVRLRFSDGDLDADAAVTDLRLYDVEQQTPDERIVADLDHWLQRGSDVILGVGLSRPYAPDLDQPPVHWLQVNAILPAEAPLWEATPDG